MMWGRRKNQTNLYPPPKTTEPTLTEARVRALIRIELAEAKPKFQLFDFMGLMKRYDIDCRSTMQTLIERPDFPEKYDPCCACYSSCPTCTYRGRGDLWASDDLDQWDRTIWNAERQKAITRHIKRAVAEAKKED